MLFIEYPKCSTCQKAKKWLDENGFEYESRHIKEESCGIKNALQRNEISESRYQNFIKIYEEFFVREEHKW